MQPPGEKIHGCAARPNEVSDCPIGTDCINLLSSFHTTPVQIPSELSAACSRHQPGISGRERVAPE
jgi:hypothetical protein